MTQINVSYPKFLVVNAKPRYWEDTNIWENGLLSLRQIPFRDSEYWRFVIDIKTGYIIDWPSGVVADVCFKVCDSCECTLLDINHNIIAKHNGYVINELCPSGGGYGDYIQMQIDTNGCIKDWKFDGYNIIK